MDEPTISQLRMVLSFANIHLQQLLEDSDFPSSEAEKAVDATLAVQNWLTEVENVLATPGADVDMARTFLQEAGLDQNVEPCLSLSTCHLEQITMDWLMEGEQPGIVGYKMSDHGCIIVVPGSTMFELHEMKMEHDYPPDLLECLERAVMQNCQWIIFDADSPEHPALKTYEWETQKL